MYELNQVRPVVLNPFCCFVCEESSLSIDFTLTYNGNVLLVFSKDQLFGLPAGSQGNIFRDIGNIVFQMSAAVKGCSPRQLQGDITFQHQGPGEEITCRDDDGSALLAAGIDGCLDGSGA